MPATATTTLTSRGVSRDVNGVKTFRRAYARDDGAPNEDMNMGVVALCRNMATRIAQCYRENRRQEREREREKGVRMRERERASNTREKGTLDWRGCVHQRGRERATESKRQGGARSSETIRGAECENEMEVLRRSIRHQLKLQ